jgi:nucleoside-diphosphate-sugar epimerase
MIEHSLYQEDLKQINQINILWSELEGKSILITGAGGLICSVLVDALLFHNEVSQLYIDIWILGRSEVILKERFGKYFDKKYFHYIIQDVSQKIRIASPIDYIIHGAGKGDPHSFITDAVGVMNANYMGMYQVLELAKEKSTKKVIYISSGEVYGILEPLKRKDMQKGISEDEYGYIDILNARACYASSKKASETLCVAYSKQHHIEVSIARPCHTYGASMLENDNRVIGELLRNALKKNDFVLKSQGKQNRSYCYVSDTCTALLYILLAGSNGAAYNIANRNSVLTIRELAEIVAKKVGTEVLYESPNEEDNKGCSNINEAVLNSYELEKLGWRPIYGILEGIDRTLEILSISEL